VTTKRSGHNKDEQSVFRTVQELVHGFQAAGLDAQAFLAKDMENICFYNVRLLESYAADDKKS
jgi:hypothetical protein